MAQVSYNKLGLKPDLNKVEKIQVSSETVIEVKQFLPFEKKLDVLSTIINKSVDDRGFYNSARVQFNTDMELIFAYTNIKFTDKQLEDIMKIYDNLVVSGLGEQIYNKIPVTERNWFYNHVNVSVKNIMDYRNSVYGILDSLQTDYSNLNLDVDAIKDKLTNDTNIKDLKDIFDKTI